LSINVDTSQSVPGTFQRSVTLQSQSNPYAALPISVALTVKPQVGFELATSQVTIPYRQGDPTAFVNVAMTLNFGSEYFNFVVTSSASWVYGNATQIDATHGTLFIGVSNQPPGIYDGTLTVGLMGLQSTSVVQVHYVVDSASGLQLSSTTLALHIVKGQPVTPAVVAVTGPIHSQTWSFSAPGLPSWLNLVQSSSTTPGELQVTADPVLAPVGINSYSVSIIGQNNASITLALNIDVASGAPLDAVPSSINSQIMRTGYYSMQQVPVAFTSPSNITVQWSTDQPWITPSLGSLTDAGRREFRT